MAGNPAGLTMQPLWPRHSDVPLDSPCCVCHQRIRALRQLLTSDRIVGSGSFVALDTKMASELLIVDVGLPPCRWDDA